MSATPTVRQSLALLVVIASVVGPLGATPATTGASAATGLLGRTATPGTTLNLRACAGTGCEVRAVIPHGTLLSLAGTSGNWFRTSYRGATGWVSSWHVVLQGTPSTAISRGTTGRRMVALTFDAGSDLGATKAILDRLRAERIPASFGITGTFARARPHAVRRMARDGHLLINHTYGHPSFTGWSTRAQPLSPARRTRQLVRANRWIRAAAGVTAKPYFRPPYGDHDAGVLRDVGASGYTRTVMWTIDSLGWKGLSASQVCSRVIGAVDADPSRGNGAIVLFHVGSQSQDAAALPCVIGGLRQRGFAFGTVAQVIGG